MKRSMILAATFGTLVFAACGPGQVVVTAEIESRNPEGEGMISQALSDKEIQLLPYDRDQVFDSLESAYSEPEPPIPDSLREARQEVADAQQEWRELESRWNTLRDTLQQVSAAMDRLNRGETRYRELFRQFQDMEGELSTVETQMEQAFQRFDSLQQGIIEQSEKIAGDRTDWANEAFADAGAVIQAKIEAAGMEPRIDTTDASGTVTFSAPPGQWWIHARHELPYTELYWNVPVEVTRDAPTEVTLSRENAEERPNL